MIGSGGREHALALALAADPAVGALHVAPGNAGTAEVGTNHPVDATDPADVVRLARELAVDLVVIGPEAPLVAGVADAAARGGVRTFGPSGGGRAARGLQGLRQAGHGRGRCADRAWPTCARRSTRSPPHSTSSARRTWSRTTGWPAGRAWSSPTTGRRPSTTPPRAWPAPAARWWSRSTSTARRSRCSRSPTGPRAVPLVPAQDFKRVGDGDTGPNTGGMGAYAPLPWAPAGLVDEVMTRVVQPTIDADAPSAARRSAACSTRAWP